MHKKFNRNIFFNRELSWLDFNSRVLAEAARPELPLLERLKFIAIFSSNLDEFFMVRIAGLHHALKKNVCTCDPAGLSPAEQLKKVLDKLDKLLALQHKLLYERLFPELSREHIHLTSVTALPAKSRQQLHNYFQTEIRPLLPSVTIIPDHSFPVIDNCAIGLVMQLQDNTSTGSKNNRFAVLEVPEFFDRFIMLGDRPGELTFIRMEELIESELPELLHSSGCRVTTCTAFRITRDMDMTIEEAGEDLLRSVKLNLQKRRLRKPIRLEVEKRATPSLRDFLIRQLQLTTQFIYDVDGMLNIKDLLELSGQCRRSDLLAPPWPPVDHPELPEHENIFRSIACHQEILLSVPFQKFDPVIRLLSEAADDPYVLSIQQTLYRVSGDSPVVAMLARAAANGKQVTAVVELKARFDENNNIAGAKKLEEAGARVIYGIFGLKIHGKALLITRREGNNIKRYLHLSTGNYNDKTAQLYTDLSIFSNNERLCDDIAVLFNVITRTSRPPAGWQCINTSPFDLRHKILSLINREADHARAGASGHIIAKMNSLSDPEIIRSLYNAAAAGVKIELIVRGICCLKPGCGNNNITVISIVDRYLEHSRIFYFANAGKNEYYLSSADLMPRNLDRRIEIFFPVTKVENICKLQKILEWELHDQSHSYLLDLNGCYQQPKMTGSASRSQRKLYDFFANEAKKINPAN